MKQDIETYRGCSLVISAPPVRAANECQIRDEILAAFPGINLTIRWDSSVHRMSIERVEVPQSHPSGGLQATEWEGNKFKDVSAELLLQKAEAKVERLNGSSKVKEG